MPDSSLLDNLGVDPRVLLPYFAVMLGLSAFACVVLAKQLNDRTHVILWSIISWVFPFIGPLAALAYVLLVSRAKTKTS